VNDLTFTGERLHDGDQLFSVDLARHQAAYELAREHVQRAGGSDLRVLELGSGSGYGAASLAAAELPLVALDRVAPDQSNRHPGCLFVRGDLDHLPLAGGRFDLLLSFQVIEHLVDPTAYIDALADLLDAEGTALVTTPNLLMSDGVNPYHVHEYRAQELAECLGRRFAEVEVLGIGATPSVHHYMTERSRRIRRIMRLDPLRIRERLPRAWLERLFATFALLVRRQSQADSVPSVTWRDFPVGPADASCLDLLAVCRQPR
jgi:2-polyprenyl-3-methyl-5-hydroxy-6-metoxy-1,4-benzoquinol methylase